MKGMHAPSPCGPAGHALATDASTHRTGTATSGDDGSKIVYWHRELPPLEAEPTAEHTVGADSSRVPGTIAHRDQLWDRCYRELMAKAESRLVQEVARLGGHFAHVHDEAIDPRHHDAAGEAWLHGRFNYMLYRRPQLTPATHGGRI